MNILGNRGLYLKSFEISYFYHVTWFFKNANACWYSYQRARAIKIHVLLRSFISTIKKRIFDSFVLFYSMFYHQQSVTGIIDYCLKMKQVWNEAFTIILHAWNLMYYGMENKSIFNQKVDDICMLRFSSYFDFRYRVVQSIEKSTNRITLFI